MRKPIVLRITPVGFLLGLALVVALIVAAYGVGHRLGVSAGRAEARGDGAGPVPGIRRGRVVEGAGGAGNSANDGDTTASAIQPDGEPRQNGLCYVVIATTSRPQAQRLLQFMSQYEVEAFAIMRHNTRLPAPGSAALYQVLAPRGFRWEDRAGPQVAQYKEQFKALGREWARQHPGEKDWSDLYLDPQPYRGERAADILKANAP